MRGRTERVRKEVTELGRKAPDVQVTCEVCGKSETVKPSRAKTYRTCSIGCRAIRSQQAFSRGVDISCAICGTTFPVKPSAVGRRKCCGKACLREYLRNRYAGEGNPNFGNRLDKCAAWKGGRRISNYGYVLIFAPDHPNSRPDGYVLEHRLVMSEVLGRPLTNAEIVHHKDENKQNNAIENLEILTLSEHQRHHNKSRSLLRDRLGRITGYEERMTSE